MSAPLQLALGTGPTHHNQYLFSDHYLDHLLPDDDRWRECRDPMAAFVAWLRGLYTNQMKQLTRYNEAQLEAHWFRPILTRLGHAFEPQAAVPGLGEGIKYPDYMLFPDKKTCQQATAAQRTDAYAAHATGYLGDYQKGEKHLEFDDLLGFLKKNRRKLSVDPSARAFQERLERECGESLGRLPPVKARLAATDRLIDLVVYRLYGLTVEEVAIVEG